MKSLRMWTAGLALLANACERSPVEASNRLAPNENGTGGVNTVQSAANPACTHHWSSGVNGNWFDATKWSPAAVPGASDVACVDAAGTYTVTLDPTVDATPIDIAALNLGAASGTQTLRLAGANLTLNVAQGIEIATNGYFFFNNSGGGVVSAASVTNDGMLKKTSPCGGCGASDALNADIVNRGTIDVFGDLSWGKTNAAYDNTGTIVLSGGPGIEIPSNAGSPTFAQNAGSVSAPTLGVLSMRSGTYTLNGGTISPSAQSALPVVRAEGANLVLGAAAGNATLGIRSDASGNASVTGDVSATTTLWLMGPVSGPGIVTFVGNPTNFGTIRPDLYFFSAPSLTLAGSGTLTNKGTIEHVVATPLEVHYAIDVDNQGAMKVPGITVIDKPGGTFVNSGSIIGGNAGSLSVVGSTLENQSSGVISSNTVIPGAGGIVRGIGSLPHLRPTSGGRVEPGLPGGVLASASYSPQANSTLEIELGGTQAGIDYDQLDVAGQATFNGTLAIVASNGFIAGRCGQTFDIITHASPGGSSTFPSVTGLSAGPGLGLRLVYHNTPPKRVSLYGYNPTTVVSVAPNPLSIAEGGPATTYAICLDHQPMANVTITATPNSQVTITPSSLVFTGANYFMPQFFTVTAVDDAVVEGNHSGTVAHIASSTDASFNGAAVASLTATIADNDFAPNQPPNATDDAATTPEEQATTLSVLANDTDPDGDPLTVMGVTQPAHGIAVVGGGGQTVTYTPAGNYHGGDSFTYNIDDGHGHAVSATVTMQVTPVNDNPVATDDAGATTAPNAVVVPVLANDSDVDGDVLSVASVTQPAAGAGTAAISGGGTRVTYTPPAAFSGTATFTYTARDGNGGTATANVTVMVQPRQGPSADLAISTQLGGDIKHPGFAVVVLVTERNFGPANSPAATVTFAQVPGLQFIKAQGGTCTVRPNGDVACARGALSNGATRKTLVVRYRALSAGNYALSGRISGVRPDPNAANDVAGVSFSRP